MSSSPSQTDPLSRLREALAEAAAEAVPAGDASPATLEPPGAGGEGDYATNAALVLAKPAGEPPREVAERIAAGLSARLGDELESAQVAGPGFVNLTLSDGWHVAALSEVASAGQGWGAGSADPPLRVNVEFVSANPTGPIHVGGTRNAAYGDSLARLLAFTGNDVHREFYVNDAGSQVVVLGESVKARARGEEPPEGGYQGDYVEALAADIPGAADLPVDEVARAAVALMVAEAERSLARMRIVFDDWFHEHTLHEGEPSAVGRSLAAMGDQDRTFEEDGALWLRTTAFGDDKDRVLMRSSGEHTYFASDIAYHRDKLDRGFDLLIDVWGADHHGYVDRMQAAFEASGGEPGALELVIMQLVHLVEGGERAKMSKRAGEFVTLEDLIDDIGVDAARWFLLARSHETTIELDLALAREQSSENPVYYVQYAHARACSILERAAREGQEAGGKPDSLHPSERALVRRLLEFPDEVAEAAARRAPHRIATWALAAAQDFSAFYRDCPVVGAEPDVAAFRLELCAATRDVLARALDLLGVTAPESMERDDQIR
ncbi:MAG: arginine--tRNA ligase [Solirubrobacteraceae bacterium]|nr:arginine--tRNA ligase [Solirubrobacteraceae bacterium]